MKKEFNPYELIIKMGLEGDYIKQEIVISLITQAYNIGKNISKEDIEIYKNRYELLAEAHTILTFLYNHDNLNLSVERKAFLYDLWFDDAKLFIKIYRDRHKLGNL